MANEQLKITGRAPIIVRCVRLFFCAVIWLFCKNLLISISLGTVSGEIILVGFVALSSVALIASFIRSKFSLILVMVSVIAIPFTFFLSMDIFMLKGTWWDWCIAFPVAFFIEMAFPILAALYMWKAPNIRMYFGCWDKSGLQIRIKGTPPGEAPENIRQAWVGLVLPVLPQFSGIHTRLGCGVLTGPKTQFGRVLAALRGRGKKQTGYIVEAKTALELLANHSKEAAEWWRQNAPQFLKPKFYFLFSADSCEEIKSEQRQES